MPTTTFTVTRDQIIAAALRKLGVLELGATPDADTLSSSSLALNLFIKQMATEGLKLWTIEEGVLPLVSNQTTYTLGPGGDYFYNASDISKTAVVDKPLKVLPSNAFIRNTTVTPSTDTPLMVISRQEYNLLGSKFSAGTPNSLYYNVRQNTGELSLFLTPDTTASSTYEVHFVYQRPIYDISSASAIPDFPVEWMNVLVWNLADQLAMDYGVALNKRQEIAVRAKAYREDLTGWDTEVVSTFFQPDYRMMFKAGGSV